MANYRKTIDEVLEKHGRTFAREAGIDVSRNTPSPLFRLLCLCLLTSARISHDIALQAARALAEAGWTTPKKLRDSTWRQRTDVLNRSGYARYDESTSRMLADTVEHLMEAFSGDLRKLRRQADGDIASLRQHLKEFKGIGDVGAGIFLREVQVAWEEVFPFLDERAQASAKRQGLPDGAARLAKYVDDREEFVRLADGLVREGLNAG